jgi:membrane fusion protein (multidrug efflux system)
VLAAAQANVEVMQAQELEAQRALAELRTAAAKADRDLSFTEIRAPIDGVIGNRAVQTGDYMQTGQRLASLVPLDAVYIDANFKETQLARLRPGQKVAISVDALPEHSIEGTVDSLAPASGAVFSLLPPDNATGNFTKIVQRVPVRVRVPADVATQSLLRPGMSVVVSINTKPAVADAGAPTPTRMAMPRVGLLPGRD